MPHESQNQGSQDRSGSVTRPLHGDRKVCSRRTQGLPLQWGRLAVFDASGEWSDAELREAADVCPMGAITVIEGGNAGS